MSDRYGEIQIFNMPEGGLFLPGTPRIQAKPDGISLAVLKEVVHKYLEIADEIGLTIVIAVAVAHQVPGEMLWVRIFGGSRCGKTEILRAVAKHNDSAEMEAITPASIRGGLGKGHRLLKRIDAKLVITKDIATILTANKEARNEVFGLLRNVKDGALTADFGTEEGFTPQKAKFDWILATTPAFAQYRQMEDLLGARYIDLNWKGGNREEMASRAMENNPRLDSEIRPRIAEAMRGLIDAAKEKWKELDATDLLDGETKKVIVDWADLTARLRSPVARDYQHRIKFHPEPEVGTDLAQGFSRIAIGLRLLGITDLKPYIARLAHDSIPYSRAKAVRHLLSGGVVSDEVSSRRDNYDVEDLGELGVAHKVNGKWQIVPELEARIAGFVKYWDDCT
jgi:hypothetical protein